MKEDFCSFPENGEKKRKNKLEKLRRQKEFEMKEIIRKKGVYALSVNIENKVVVGRVC